MSAKSLQDVLDAAGNIVEHLRNSQIGAYVYPVVAPEFDNWRSEQMAWRETAVLFDQSHHMSELMVEGPDAKKLLSYLAINSFENFPVGRAKHFVPCSHSGHVIGDVICFHEDENRYNLVGRTPTITWVQFHAETGGYDVVIGRDDRSPSRPMGKPVTRRHYRYQIQGPNADKILSKVNGGPIPDVKFFHLDRINVGKRRVKALRHGMSGAPGLELWGPYEEGDEIRDILVEAGKEFGMVQVGSRAYSTNTLESGWIPSPLPAIYTGEGERAYRQWMPAACYEATGAIAGSYVSDNIEDYYCTPYELGYGFYVKFDHDFIGREALEKIHDQPHRRKTTFEWNAEDVMKVMASHFRPGEENYKTIDLPQPNYASTSADMVMMGDKMVGISMFNGYSYNERAMLSLGMVDPDIKEGDVLTMVWGEPDGGTRKTTVEPHKQCEIRVRVSKTPYSAEARENYADSWRTKSA